MAKLSAKVFVRPWKRIGAELIIEPAYARAIYGVYLVANIALSVINLTDRMYDWMAGLR